MGQLNNSNGVNLRWKYFWVAVTIICCLGGAYGLHYYFWEYYPLVSDEEMIAHFRAHRADFEELVKRYRNYPRTRLNYKPYWYKDGDTQEIMQRAGVARLSRLVPAWYPNPYSVESAKQFHELVNSGEASKRGLFFKYDTIIVTPVRKPRLLPLLRSRTNQYRYNSIVYNTIWKDYCHIPVIPRIENGELLWPLKIVGKGARVMKYREIIEINGVYVSQYRDRVLPSLNGFPKQWRDFECVFRQIEPQWFIRMCNGH